MAMTTPTPMPMEQFFGGVQQQQQQQPQQRRGAAADAAERSHDDVWGPNSAEWGRAMVQNYLEATTTTNADNPAAASNNGSIRSTTSRPRIIPHILHFIWLGPKPLPALFETKLLDSWKEHHEGWHVKVWRNRDLEALLQEQQQQQQQHAAAAALDYALQHGHYGMASDIMRCLVLYKYGGVYVDIDYLCVDSFSSCFLTTTSSCCSTTTTTTTRTHEHPHHDLPFDFVCGASNVGGGSTIEVNNGILACKPQSALVKLVLKDVSAWFQQVARPLTLVSAFLGNTHAACSTGRSNSLLTDEDVIRHTGPGVWTRILGQVLLQQQEQQQQQQQEQQESSSVLDEQIMVFPYSVFHPMPNTDRHFVKWQEYEDEDECERGVLDAIVDRYAIPGITKAIHLWQCTWQQQEQQAHQTNRNRDDIDYDDETMIV